MITIRPTGNLVVIQPIESGLRTQGGLHLPESAKPAQQIWRVLHVGPGRRSKNGSRIPIDLKPGDKVITPEVFNNRMIYTDGVQVVDAEEIVAKIEG